MRTDFGLYTLAVIFFIIAALPYTDFIPVEVLRLHHPVDLTVTVIFAALGLISIILGYSKRPKPRIFVPEAPKPTPAETSASSPTPTYPAEETAKPTKKKRSTRTRRKTRRKKV